MSNKRKPTGITEAHVRITLKLLQSPAFIALDWTARALFLDLRSKLRGSNNGNINAALSELKHRGWRSPTTLAKALRQLEAVGLVEKTRQTIGVERGSQVCNLYRFTDVDVYEFPKLAINAKKATHDYLKFESLGHARNAVRSASVPKKRSQQNLQRDATDFAADKAIIATDSVVRTTEKNTETVASHHAKTSANPMLSRHSGPLHLPQKPEKATTDPVHL